MSEPRSVIRRTARGRTRRCFELDLLEELGNEHDDFDDIPSRREGNDAR